MNRTAMTGVMAAMLLFCGAALAVQPQSRIAGQIDSSDRVELPGTTSHRVVSATAVGHLPGDTPLTHMGLVLAPSAVQNAALDRLLSDQQNPASASYHQWLTPAAFGARFGVSDSDLTKIKAWLEGQGFDIDSVAPSRNTVFFSGSAASVESAFGVSMQRFHRNGQDFFENSGNVRVPAALSGVVTGITSLSSYRLKGSRISHINAESKAKPAYTTTDTSGVTTHNLTPWDFRQIYGLNTLFNAGDTGVVKIAVVGQSAVNATQIAYFQGLTGQSVKAPTLVLVPSTGTSTLVSGDEGESEIDIEYSGGTASGATIEFVYTGNGNNNGVFDSVIYAVTNGVAPIITMSYGGCETDYTSFATQTFEPYLRQANAQGQTVLVSSGDADAATCDVDDSSSTSVTSATLGATVSYPASSPYVTGVGGSSFDEGTGTYWSTTNNSYAGSATGYIPEIAWNETTLQGGDLTGSGGGASALFGKPSWQAGTGVPADGARDVPDVAFNAAINHDAYLYCSAETTYGVGAEACTASAFGAYVVGGTSLSAPNFAAMLAIVEQTDASTTGLGNINPSIYALAASSNSAAVFHDITSGNNIVPCVIGSADCTTGTLGYTTGVGYDQVTGWGSVNGAALATGLASQSAVSALTPTLSLSASPITPAINTSITLTAAVAAASSTIVPTGTVQFTLDGTSVGTETVSSGYATYTISSGFASVGTHTVTATYSGDSKYNSTTSTLTLVVAAVPSASFTLAPFPSTLTIASGGSGSEIVTVTPVGGFAGILSFTAAATGSGTLNACYSLPDADVTSSGGSAKMTIYTSTSDCATTGRIRIPNVKRKLVAGSRPVNLPPFPGKRSTILLGGVLLGCFALRRRTKIPMLLVLGLCAMAIPGLGCGSGGSTSPVSTPVGTTTGTSYTITVTGTSSTDSALTASTSFTLTIS